MQFTGRHFILCYLYSAVVLFGFLNFSTATFNPAYHPQHQQGVYHHDADQQWDGAPPRGGSTRTMAVAEPTPQKVEPFQPPKIHLKHMSMALRLTSEWNRRLLAGVNRLNFWGKRESQPQQIPDSQQPQPGYGTHPVNVHPSRSWHLPIQDTIPQMEEELTLFHAKVPRESSNKTQRRGVAHWGPELLPYLEHVVDLLGVEDDGVEIPLSMIYLDRACSVENLRHNGVPPCPFCTPRTVHRLTLAALLLARQAVTGDDFLLEEQYIKLQSLGIPLAQLQQMVDWMRGALGDTGLLVTMDQMKKWSQSWDSIFYPKQQEQRILELQQQQQQHEKNMQAPQYQQVPQIQHTSYQSYQ